MTSESDKWCLVAGNSNLAQQRLLGGMTVSSRHTDSHALLVWLLPRLLWLPVVLHEVVHDGATSQSYYYLLSEDKGEASMLDIRRHRFAVTGGCLSIPVELGASLSLFNTCDGPLAKLVSTDQHGSLEISSILFLFINQLFQTWPIHAVPPNFPVMAGLKKHRVL